MRTIARNNGRRSPKKNLQIKPEGPATGVPQIQTNHLIKLDSTTPFDLPQSRNPRLDSQYTTPMPNVVGFEFVYQRGTGAYERHFAHEYIPQLRKLIQARLA
jgi:hypothetical protein